MDLGDTLKLEELAQRLVPRTFKCWRTLSDILSGDREKSPRYIRNRDRREIPKRRMWRRRLLDQYGLDDQLLPKGTFGRQERSRLAVWKRWRIAVPKNEFAHRPIGLFRKKLSEAPNLKARQKLVIEEARHLARAEVRGMSSSRLKRARDRAGCRVLAALSAELRANGTRVTGIEIQHTLDRPHPAKRAVITAEHLVHANIDIVADSLTEGGRQWRHVTVRLGQVPVVDGAQVASNKKAALGSSDQEIALWMLDKQKKLPRGKRGRDKLIPLASKHFGGVKQSVIRRSWDGRPGAPRRK